MFKDRKTKLSPPFNGPGVDEEILYEEKEFYYALGRAISQWADVEERLYLLYQKIIHSENSFGMSASYHSVINISSKVDMIDKTIRATYYDQEIIKKWGTLLNRIKTKNATRNNIAHFSTHFNVSHEIGGKIYLMPSISNINAAKAGKTLNKKYTYNTKKLEEIVPVFRKLATDIHDFVLVLPYPSFG